MPIYEIVLTVTALLTVAVLAAGVCRNFPVPYTLFLLVLGLVLGSTARSFPAMHFLLEFRLTPDLVLYLFLPALVFNYAFAPDARQLLRDLAPNLALAFPSLLLSTAIIAGGLWWLAGWQPGPALLFAVLISATDTAAVINLFRELGTPGRLTALVEGSALFNDLGAIMVFNTILALLAGGSLAWNGAFPHFLWLFLGGTAVGVIIGLAVSLLLRLFAGVNAFLIMSIVAAYAGFVIAAHGLHASGVMATAAAAVTLGVIRAGRLPRETTAVIRDAWEVIALIGNSLLFLLAGLSVNAADLGTGIGVIALAVALTLLARAAMVYGLVPAATGLFSLPRISFGERHLLWWGGLKGGLPLAVALTIPADMPGRDLLLAATLGVIVFSLLVKASSTRTLIRKLGMDRLSPDELAEVREGLVSAGRKTAALIDMFESNTVLRPDSARQVRDDTQALFSGDAAADTAEQTLRRLRGTALKTEFRELMHLYDIGLIPHYTYLDMRNNLQRYRETLGAGYNPAREALTGFQESPFLRFENAMIKRLREHDWAAWLLARYQNLRLAQRIQHDIAGVLICNAVLDMLDTRTEAEPVQREQVAREYRQRLTRRRDRLARIAADFPEFYARFETSLFSRVSLTAAAHYLEELHDDGVIGARAYRRIERMINAALDTVPPVTDTAPKPAAAELIGGVPLLRDLPEPILERLAQLASVVTFLPDDLIIEEGERGDALYIITHGAVQVFMDNQYLTELQDGDFFGEMALLGDQVRTATIRTRKPTRLLRLRRRDVLRLADSAPDLKSRLAEADRERKKADSRRGLG